MYTFTQSSMLAGPYPPFLFIYHHSDMKRCPRGVMVKAMEYGIVVSEFKLQSHYYAHFRTNTFRKGMSRLSTTLIV